MLDVITLQARGQHKQEQYRQEAAHERLLRQLRPAVTDVPVGWPARLSQLGSLLLVAAVLLLGLALRPAEAAPAASVAITTAVPPLAPTVGSNCWVSGDLVGDANPATIAAALCDR